MVLSVMQSQMMEANELGLMQDVLLDWQAST